MRRLRGVAVHAPVWGVVALCSGLPLAWIAIQIAMNPAVLVELRLEGFRAGLLGRTLLYNALAAVIATAMALPAALVLGRGRGWAPAVLWFVLPVALLMPSIAYAYGWSQFVRLHSDFFAGIGITFEPGGAADVARCIWSLATWLWALPAGVIGLALRRMDTQVQQQALLDGALWRVTFRQLAGPIAASMAMVAVLSMQEFAVYEPTGISVVATEVRMVFDTGAFSSLENPMTAPILGGGIGTPAAGDLASLGLMNQGARAAAAVVTSVPLLGVIALLAVVAIVGVRRISAADQVETGPWPRALNSGWWAVAASAVLVAITLGAPVWSMIESMRRPLDLVRMWHAVSPQATGSLLIAAVTGVLAAALALWATTRRYRVALAVGVVAFLVGGQLMAIAQIRLYNHPGLAWIYNAPPIIVMAYLGRFGWIALLAASLTWGRPWQELREVAAVDGADALRTAWHVIWPIAWPVCCAAGVLVMILSLTEVPATVLLSPQRPPMLVPLLMTWVHMLRNDDMLEGSLLLMAMVLVLAIVAVALVWAGARIGRGWRMEDRGLRMAAGVRRAVLLVLGASVLMAPGCREGSRPAAIWCETGTGPSQVVYPRAITYWPQGDVFFIVDRMARIQKLDRDGNHLTEWRMPKWEWGKPVGLSVGPDGLVYIADTHYARVMVYTPDGQFVRSWGSAGRGPGQFIYPTDVAFDDQGRVFVSEYGDNDRIQVFDMEGEYLYEIGRFGQGDGEFSRPQSMLIDGEMLYITDAGNHRIAVFRTDGAFVRNLGRVGSGPGEFRFPYGLAQDSRGNLVVCEFGNNRVQLIDPQTGEGLRTWGAGGRAPGELAYPWGVAVDSHNRIVAVDAGNNRLQVFRF